MKTCEAKRVLGALDALGVALARHGHVWTGAERSGYEGARAGLTAMEATEAAGGRVRTATPVAYSREMELMEMAVKLTSGCPDARLAEERLRAVYAEMRRLAGAERRGETEHPTAERRRPDYANDPPHVLVNQDGLGGTLAGDLERLGVRCVEFSMGDVRAERRARGCSECTACPLRSAQSDARGQ